MSLSNRLSGAALAFCGLMAADMLLPPLPVAGPAPAHAIVGRPASPVSVAGVARRTTRRAVVVTGTAAAAAAPTTVVVQQAPAPAAAAPAPTAAPAPAAAPPKPQ
jgi:hypothetical protein